MDTERLVPQEETVKRAEDGARGVMLDPDSIRKLLEKLRNKENEA